MDDSGGWWYDSIQPAGETADPSYNADMISPAFWLVGGSEIKITRSDDSGHTPLLGTTGNCLSGKTFRSKMTSNGDFRNGSVWSNGLCLGKCNVLYRGQYQTTEGFGQTSCAVTCKVLMRSASGVAENGAVLWSWLEEAVLIFQVPITELGQRWQNLLLLKSKKITGENLTLVATHGTW